MCLVPVVLSFTQAYKISRVRGKTTCRSVAVCLWKIQEIDKNLCSFFSMLCYLVTVILL